MHGRVGAFFHNTVWTPYRTCAVCAHPVDGWELCFQCNSNRAQWGGQLADVVMLLGYAYRRSDENRARLGLHQSEQHVWSYKQDQPGRGSVVDLAVMLLVALEWHRGCAERRVGLPWGAWTVVPSSRREREGEHPLVDLAERAGLAEGGPARLPRVQLATVGPPSGDRVVRADRFRVQDPAAVQGRHVLVLEDTWVTSSSCQSAAVALKAAGASAVTVLCLARWLREDWRTADAAGLFASLPQQYDALVCPMPPGQRCSGPLTTS